MQLRAALAARLGLRATAWGLVIAGASGALTACIIPDRGIRAESDDDNPGAVRVVESIPIVQELLDACQLDPKDDDYDPRGCPQVPAALPQGIIGGGPFCSCPSGDTNTVPEFSIYAEDPDRRRDQPADTLYAVALLDLDPFTDAPQNYVAYREHLTPGGRGEHVSRSPGTLPSVGREDNGLWRFRFGKDGGLGVDLCNDDNGQTLALGLHQLQIMVTDRPFFQPARLDASGDPVLDPAGRPVLLPTQYGMPDLGIGATWAVANYVFACQDPAVQSACACAEDAP